MKKRYSIGEVARFHNIAIGTLRYYDAVGLFCPAEVDADSGYRYYSLEQFEQLDTICYLKFLGFSLKEIRHHLQSRDAGHFLTLLRQQQQITQAAIQKLGKINGQLNNRIQEIEMALGMKELGKPLIKSLPQRQVVSIAEPIYSGPEMELALRKLQGRLEERLPLFVGRVGLTVSKENLLQKTFDEYNSVFILPEEPEAAVGAVHCLPEGPYGCIYFHGGHNQSRPYYEALLQFVDAQGYEAAGDAVERMLIDEYVSLDSNDHLTEIEIPLLKRA